MSSAYANVDRIERIALDLTKLIIEKALNDGNAPTKDEILDIYSEAYIMVKDRKRK